MEYAILIMLVAVVAIIGSAVARAKRKRELFAEARQFMEAANQRQALPTVASNVILKSGESAFYWAPSELYETRAVRHYQSSFASFRVAKGLTIGGSKGRSVSTQEWSKIDGGRLTITNKRLIFDGRGADRTIMLRKIVSVESSLNDVEVSVEGRQKSMIFKGNNPLIVAAIIRICCQVDNPLDLSQTKLNVTFVE